MVLRAGCVIEPRPYDSGAHPAAYGTQQRPSSAIGNWVFAVPTLQGLANVEVPPGFEPGNKGFADLRLTAWLWHRVWSGRRDSNSRHPPWQGGTLPLSYYRTPGALGRNRTTDTEIFSLLLYRRSYQGKKWRPRRGSNPRPPA